jgi:hypothetical protein
MLIHIGILSIGDKRGEKKKNYDVIPGFHNNPEIVIIFLNHAS